MYRSSIWVTSTSGDLLSDASMRIVKRNVKPEFKRTTKIDSSGHYQFPDLTPGVYDVTAAKKVYACLRKRVTLGASEDKVVGFALKPKG